MPVYKTINIVFNIIEFAILIRVLSSWLPIPRENRFIQMLHVITEPILGPIRAMIERSSFGKNMMFDFSPIVAIILVEILKNIILSILF